MVLPLVTEEETALPPGVGAQSSRTQNPIWYHFSLSFRNSTSSQPCRSMVLSCGIQEVPFSSTGSVPAPVIPQTFLYWVVGQPHPWRSLQDKLSSFFQYGQDENFPGLQVQVPFYSTISSSVPLSLLSTSVRRNQDTPSTLCLDISSAKHPVSSVTNSTFHKTPEHRSSSLSLYNQDHLPSSF